MLAKGRFLELPCGFYESIKITTRAILVLKQFKTHVNELNLGMAMGRMGTGFTFPVSIPYSYILIFYPTHTQQG